MRALFLLADGFDDLSLFVPWFRLKEEGLDTFLAGRGRRGTGRDRVERPADFICHATPSLRLTLKPAAGACGQLSPLQDGLRGTERAGVPPWCCRGGRGG